ncbi:MAG: FAD-binding protein [Chloroflexi bacterium]|nr:FAD-binding protein [Chloroflexota bacterium]
MAHRTITKDCDVLVVGGGIAGTFAAIRARAAGAGKVVQVDKGWVGKSGMSAFAAGVLTAVAFPGEDIAARVKDTVEQGRFLYMQDRVRDHFENVWEVVKELDDFGAGFLRTKTGDYEKTAGRGKAPLLMFPGNKLMDSLAKAAARRKVEQVNKTMIVDLFTNQGRVAGAAGFNIENGDFCVFRAKAVALATGSSRYKGLAPNHRCCSGDGYAAAYRAGAVLSSAESSERPAQAFAARWDIGPGMNMFVGQGGIFLNARGERFMEKYDPVLKDRADLISLTQAFAMEARQGRTPIYLDMTHFAPEQMDKMKVVLPLPWRMFERAGLIAGGRFVAPVEWMITSPWARSGIEVDIRGASSLPGLFACGEVTALQSFSSELSPCATQGALTGKYAGEYAGSCDIPDIDPAQLRAVEERIFRPLERKDGVEPGQVVLGIQEAVTPYDVWHIQHETRLKAALERVLEIRSDELPLLRAYDPHYLRMAHEAANLVMVAEASLRSAIFRKESRFAIREDFPYVDNQGWLKWTEVRNEGKAMRVTARDVPIWGYPYQPENRQRYLHPRWETAASLGMVRVEDEVVRWA